MTDGPLSPRNKRVTAARRLLKRAFRAEARAFLVEGPQAVREALALAAERPGLVRQVFVTGDAEARHPELLGAARALDVEVDHVGAEVLAELAQTVTPQGVVAVCGFVDVPLAQLLDGPAAQGRTPALVAVLAHVRDPGNAGTVVRAADAAGADGVVLTEASVDLYNGKCVRATAGSLFHLPVVTGEPAAAAVTALRAAGLRVVAADGAGEHDLDEEADSGALAVPTAWVFGNEAWGLPEETLALCDAVVRVPIHGRAESLNLATAAAVCLYASARAQR
jgi:RNA methyltransferase, TrmH family